MAQTHLTYSEEEDKFLARTDHSSSMPRLADACEARGYLVKQG